MRRALCGLAFLLLSFLPSPASACYYCFQGIACEPGTTRCRIVVVCETAPSPCTNCTRECGELEGRCNQDPEALCEFARERPPEWRRWVPPAAPAGQASAVPG